MSEKIFCSTRLRYGFLLKAGFMYGLSRRLGNGLRILLDGIPVEVHVVLELETGEQGSYFFFDEPVVWLAFVLQTPRV